MYVPMGNRAYLIGDIKFLQLVKQRREKKMTTIKTINKFTGKYRFLSNFYISEIKYEDQLFPSSEHAYQAAKTTDKALREILTDAGVSAGQAKRVGRQFKLRDGWDDIKADIMKDIVRLKFFRNSGLALKLIDTGDATLIEGNTWGDVFFGVCDGVGENHLGKILMHVRKELNDGKLNV